MNMAPLGMVLGALERFTPYLVRLHKVSPTLCVGEWDPPAQYNSQMYLAPVLQISVHHISPGISKP